MGELSLDGTLQPVKGVLPIALRAYVYFLLFIFFIIKYFK